MELQDYVTKLNNEMANNTTYQQVAADNTNTVQNKVNKIATTLCSKESISANVIGYITTTGGTSGKLQGNPKLHKTGSLRTIENGHNHPMKKDGESSRK